MNSLLEIKLFEVMKIFTMKYKVLLTYFKVNKTATCWFKYQQAKYSLDTLAMKEQYVSLI